MGRTLTRGRSRTASKWLRAACAVVLGCLSAIGPASLEAAEFRGDDVVTVGPNERIDDDLYAFGGSVTVQGTVNGDLVAFGGNIRVTGGVTGDVIAAGGNITLDGQVGGSVRASGGDLTINGRIGET